MKNKLIASAAVSKRIKAYFVLHFNKLCESVSEVQGGHNVSDSRSSRLFLKF